MVTIYLCHFFPKDGLSHAFVFSFHVPLFFFLAGCTETISKQCGFTEYVLKKARAILLPWFCFSVASTFVYILIHDSSMHEVKELIIWICLGGIRMMSVAPALWFLTGLFVLQVLFCVIKKLKYPAIIIPLSLGLHLFAKTIVCTSTEEVSQSPVIYHLFNWDWACYHLIYYVIGFYSFSALNKWFKLCKGWQINTFRICLLFTTIVAALVFEQKNYVSAMLSGNNELLKKHGGL